LAYRACQGYESDPPDHEQSGKHHSEAQRVCHAHELPECVEDFSTSEGWRGHTRLIERDIPADMARASNAAWNAFGCWKAPVSRHLPRRNACRVSNGGLDLLWHAG